MHIKNKKNQQQNFEKRKVSKFSLLRSGLLILFLSLVALTSYLLIKLPKERADTTQTLNSDSSLDKSETTIFEVPWEVYTNQEFGFQLMLPRFLYKREFKDEGGYIFFARFEENEFSQGKGVAIGIKVIGLDDEANSTKKDFQNEASLEEGKQVDIGEFNGTYLRFKPKEEGMEERVIVLLEKEGKVFSISTVPEQMDRIIESFKFL